MGDRCDGTLTVYGKISAEKWAALCKALAECGYVDDTDVDECARGVTVDNSWSLTEVNYGTLPDDVFEAVKGSGLSWAWLHGAGYGYDGEIEIRSVEPDVEEVALFNTIDGEIGLSISDALDDEKLKDAARWSNWLDTSELEVTE